MFGSVVLVSGIVWLGVRWGVTDMEVCGFQMGLNTRRERRDGIK